MLFVRCWSDCLGHLPTAQASGMLVIWTFNLNFPDWVERSGLNGTLGCCAWGIYSNWLLCFRPVQNQIPLCRIPGICSSETSRERWRQERNGMYTVHQIENFRNAKEVHEVSSVKQTFLSNIELCWSCNDRKNPKLKVDRYHYEGTFTTVYIKIAIAFSMRLNR